MTELEMICKKSETNVSECDCPLCQSMCLNAPCIGTPADIVTLINHGYIHELELTFWDAGKQIGIEPYGCIQIRRNEDGSCPLFKKGKCTVHEIKPTDGKLASCKDLFYDKSKPSYLHLIAEAWNRPHNVKLMTFIIKSLYRYQKNVSPI